MHAAVRRATRLGVAGALAVVATFVAAPVQAASASQQDQTWIVAAHQSNLAENAAGADAQQNATTDGVKSLGEHRVEDHTRLDRVVQQLAQKYDVTLPDAPSPAQQAALQRVKANSGEACDRGWVR